MTWQPIETAPSNKFVLVCRPTGMITTPYEYTTAKLRARYSEWCDCNNDLLVDSGREPDHWMPLPEPPEAQPSPSNPLLRSHDVVE